MLYLVLFPKLGVNVIPPALIALVKVIAPEIPTGVEVALPNEAISVTAVPVGQVMFALVPSL